MKKLINTIFDYAREIPEPQYSVIYDTESKQTNFIPLYLKETKKTIKEIRASLLMIFETIKSGGVTINDALSHMLVLKKYGHEPSTKFEIFESRLSRENSNFDSENQLRKDLVRGLIEMPKRIDDWMSVKAKSSVVYAELASRGIMWGPHHEYPIYDTMTLTGRSRTRGFNIQGATVGDPIHHIDEDRKIFLCFDWVSADMRVAGFMSNDDFINHSFFNSDPYTELEKLLGCNDITRDDCKLEMLKSIYSVNFDGPLLDVMPKLKTWMAEKKAEYDSGKLLRTILGMAIPREDLKSSFNGMIQGSIAEAIQNVLIKISEKIGNECILTEIHDSLVVCCSDGDLTKTISDIVPIMLRPFDNVNLSLPVKVSVGRKWKRWKEYRVFR